MGAAQQVTQQRQLEQERQNLVDQLAQKNAFIEAVLGQVPVGIVVAEANSGKLITSNREAERITGIEYAPGTSVDELASPTRSPARVPMEHPTCQANGPCNGLCEAKSFMRESFSHGARPVDAFKRQRRANQRS